jgi:hypothetical protein
MRKLLLSLAACCIVGCADPDKPHFTANGQMLNYEIVTIDGCEYIYAAFAGSSNTSMLCHKGNCKNPIHAYRLESGVKQGE